MTGHKTEAVYHRYAIVSEADLHHAARQLERGDGHSFGHSHPNSGRCRHRGSR